MEERIIIILQAEMGLHALHSLHSSQVCGLMCTMHIAYIYNYFEIGLSIEYDSKMAFLVSYALYTMYRGVPMLSCVHCVTI